ncbi:MAG: hypothetical protein ABIT01_07160, partial [Thermoanaerobaculia bacterium]
MRNSNLAAVAALVFTALLPGPLLGKDGERRENPEGPEHARLRARAFEDMYADPYGRRDPERKLRAARFLQQEAARRSPLAIGGSVFTSLGPTNVAGRVSALAVHPTNTNIIYRGTAGGGVWKTVDGGATWTVLTDSLGNLSIGAIALAPSNPNLVYVGTGEGALSGDVINGIGFIKSTDAGATWSLPLSVSATLFFDLTVHPTIPTEVLAATDVGMQLSTDGGSTWSRSVGNEVATALSRDRQNPANVLATTWDVRVANKGSIHLSTDGGRTFTRVATAGVAPFESNTGRISIARSPSNPSIAYALAAAANGNGNPACSTDPTDQTGVYRSTDGGQTWAFRNNPIGGSCGSFFCILGTQGWYANALIVDPVNPDIVYGGGLDTYKSTDGGSSWQQLSLWYRNPGDSQYVHADIHVLAFQGTTLLVGNDGGVDRSTDGGTSFATVNAGIVTRQYYGLAVTPANRALVIAGAQDNGTNLRTTSTTSFTDRIGGDGFAVAADQTNANILYSTIYNSRIYRSTDAGGTFPEITPSFADGENRPFISPLAMDPTNSSILYTGSQYLYKTVNGGSSWSKSSGTDLGDGSGRGYLTKIAVSRSNPNVILTATGSGNVRKSTDGGSSFTVSLSGGLPSGKFASDVSFDPASSNVFYVAYTGAGSGGFLYRTSNGGSSFTLIDNGLPSFPIHVLRVDPTDSTALYAGTDVGLYRSTDSGASWQRFGTGIPAVSIWDIAILPDGTLLRVATHGRGIWELTIGGGNPGGSCTPGELFTDSGFEAGDSPSGPSGASGTSGSWSWTSQGGNNPVHKAAPSEPSPHTGAWYAYLGGYGAANVDSVEQQATIPSGATAKLTFWLRVGTLETTANSDTLKVQVTNASGQVLSTLATYSDVDVSAGYSQKTLDVSAYAGQTVRVRFVGTEDFSLATSFFVDDVLLTATCGSGSVTNYVLTVSKAGSGSGTVTSSPSAVSCGSACTGTFASGQSVTLTAAALAGSTFTGWSGACGGVGSCEVTMTADQSVTALFTSSTSGGSSATKLIPIVLDVGGAGGSRFSTELTLANRGSSAATLLLTYVPSSLFGTAGGGTVSETLGAGRQRVITDTLAYLRGKGLAIPSNGSNQGGTLRVAFSGLSSPTVAFAGARTSTPSGSGRAGLSYPGVRPEDAVADTCTVFGLRENATDRSNLALVNASSSASVTLRITLVQNDGGGAQVVDLSPDITLAPGQWTQISRVLAQANFTNGYAIVTRLSGAGSFLAYGVFNDNFNNDGSFVPLTPSGAAGEIQLLPVLVETSTFQSELVLSNPYTDTLSVKLAYVESISPSLGAGGTVTESLAPGQQKIIPNAIDYLRRKGAGVGPLGSAAYAGALQVTFTTLNT